MGMEGPKNLVSLDAERLKKEREAGTNRDLENIDTRVHPEPDDPKPYEPEKPGAQPEAGTVPPEHFTYTNVIAALSMIEEHLRCRSTDPEHKLNLLVGIKNRYLRSKEAGGPGASDSLTGLEAVEAAQKLF